MQWILALRELIYCRGGTNFEHILQERNIFFLHSLMSCKNDVVSSVMELFVHTKEYIKASMTLQMLNRVIIKL